MQHLDEGVIHAWLDGALPPAEAAPVEAHVASCAECAARVAEARGLIAGATRVISALDAVPGHVIPTQPRAGSSSPLWRRLALTPSRAAIAALLLVGVASMFSVRHQGTARGVPIGTVVGDPPAQSRAINAPTPVAAQPANPASQPVKRVEPVAPRPAAKPAAAAAAPTPPATAEASVNSDAVKTMVAGGIARPSTTAPIDVRAEAATLATKPRADTLDMRDARETRDQVNADAPARRLLANGRVGAAAAVMRTVSFEGCYSIPDSLRRETPRLPLGFALQKDSVGANVVRTLSALNRPDSVIPGASWRVLPPASVIVQSPLNVRPGGIVLGPSRRVDCRP